MPEAAPRTNPDASDATNPPEIPDYTLLRRIGRGSYGDVWLARSVTGVFRVIKVVQRNRFQDERPYLRELEGISRFQAAVSGRPRQLALLHVGRNDQAGYFYYVMEPADDAETGSSIDPDRYVPLTLRELLQRRGRLPAQECVQLALELARGLAVLHGENLIHRDIKPSNVIFVQRVPKLADVGLVASADAALTCVGTPGYIPNEGPGSVSADIYSLGKVLYVLATGMEPSQYPRLPADLADHADAPLLREINSIVLKACSRYPEERHTSAEHLARDLEIVQAGRSVAFYEEFRKRSRVILAATATFALLAGFAAALFVWRSQVLEAANSESRQALYRSDIAVAQLAVMSGELGRARDALAGQIPRPGQEDLRGLEWAILAHAVLGDGRPLVPIAEPSAISRIAVDPSDRWLAASFIDDRIGVWDLYNGQLIRVIENARVLGGFLSDGQLVIDEPSRAIRYETPSGSETHRIATGQRLYSMLPDGRLLVVTPDGDLVFRLLKQGTTEIEGEFNLSRTAGDFTNSGQEISPDGSTLIVGAYQEEGAIRERIVICADLKTGRELWRFQPHSRIVWVRWSPVGKQVAINIGGLGASLLDPKSGKRQTSLVGHRARVQDAAFSADGLLIATAGADQSVRVWDTQSGKPVSVHRGLGRPVTAVAWLNGTNHVIASDDSGSVRVFPVHQGPTPDFAEGLFDDLHGDLAYSPDNKLIAVTKSTNQIALITTRDCREVGLITNLFQPIVFSDDGRKLFALSSDWSLWMCDLSDNSKKNTGIRLPLGFSVDGWTVSRRWQRAAFSGNSGNIIILELGTPKAITLQTNPTNRVWGLVFSNDGKYLWTGAESGVIRSWNTADGTPLAEQVTLAGDIQALALSPDERWLAVSLYNDASLQVWDRLKQEWLHPRYGHRRFVQSLLFTPDGDRLVSGGVDGRVIIWRVPDFQEIASFEVSQAKNPDGDEGIATLRLAPNGAGMAALTEDGRLQIWRTR